MLPIEKFVPRLPELGNVGLMLDAFFSEPGATSPALRKAIEARSAELNGGKREASGTSAAIPEVVQTYVDKVAKDAYKVLDSDFEAMKEAGYSEDYIYEITLAATTGATLARLERGLELLEA